MAGSFCGARLKRAREESGLSQGEFARAVGLSSEYISLLESSKRIPSLATLKQIASFLSKEMGFFFLEKKPGIEDFLDDPRIPETLKPELNKFKKYCLDYLTLEEKTGRYLALAPNYINLSPEQLAEEERRRLDLGEEPIRDIFNLLEMNGLRIVRQALSAEFRLAGVFVFDQQKEAAFCLINRSESPGFQIVAAAHFYGHYLKDREAGLILDNMDVMIDEYVSLYSPREQFAQEFAAYFLVPPSKLKSCIEKCAGTHSLTFDEVILIKRYFGVDTRTLVRVLKKYDLISNKQFEDYYKRSSTDREKKIFGYISESEQGKSFPASKRSKIVVSERYRVLAVEASRME